MPFDLSRRQTLAWVARAGLFSLIGGRAAAAPVAGYGNDPPLADPRIPWALTLAPAQLDRLRVLSDLVLPGSAALGVPSFIDEWVSAPYALQREDRRLLLVGLDWLDRQGRFTELPPAAAAALLDRICDLAKAAPEAGEAARFFARFRQLCLIGYYTTEEGMAEIGYVGNQPSDGFAGPPPEVLARLNARQPP